MTRIRQQPRRASLFALVTLCVLLAALISRASDPARATSGGSAYDIPLVTDTNPAADIVETTIVANETNEDIGLPGGLMAHAETFNGSVPGPTFRLNVGDTVIVHFENDIPRITGIHWHGIELAERDGRDAVHAEPGAPGGTFLYKFKVTAPGDLLVPPAPPLLDQPGVQGPVRADHRHRPERSAAAGQPCLSAAEHVHAGAQRHRRSARRRAPSRHADLPRRALPHVSGGPLPARPARRRRTLCETTPDREDADEDGNPRAPTTRRATFPYIQNTRGRRARHQRGPDRADQRDERGRRVRDPVAPGALAGGALTLDVAGRVRACASSS